MNKLKKQHLLDQIKTDIIKQNICLDLAQEATNLVMGHGNLNAKFLFVGEAPGKQEDISGTPFVGSAGKLLDKLLDSIDVNRSDVYITNIVKYRPPNNRDPLSQEKSDFAPFLATEIGIIDPKVVITLGRHSLNYFLPSAEIGKVHGTTSSTDIGNKTYKLLPMYHPAAAIYNRSLEATLFTDIQHLKIFKSINQY